MEMAQNLFRNMPEQVGKGRAAGAAKHLAAARTPA